MVTCDSLSSSNIVDICAIEFGQGSVELSVCCCPVICGIFVDTETHMTRLADSLDLQYGYLGCK